MIVVAGVLAAVSPAWADSSKPGEIDLKIDVSVDKPPVAAGSQGEAVMTLTPPAGIHINRYPPVRLTLEPPSAVTFDATTFKVGLDAMPDDPEKNPFETVDPIRMKFKVGQAARAGQVPVKGKLKFFYCVAKSGYCAPGNKDVTFNVPVAAAR